LEVDFSELAALFLSILIIGSSLLSIVPDLCDVGVVPFSDGDPHIELRIFECSNISVSDFPTG